MKCRSASMGFVEEDPFESWALRAPSNMRIGRTSIAPWSIPARHIRFAEERDECSFGPTRNELFCFEEAHGRLFALALLAWTARNLPGAAVGAEVIPI
jgi:hypothetical protein